MKVVSGLGQCSLDYIASVDSFPEEDTKKEALDFTVQGGGPVATALVALSRLNVRTVFLGVVSDDSAGIEIKKGLKKEGVDIRGLVVKKGGGSQRAFIIVNRALGSRTILWQRPGVAELKASEVKALPIKKSRFLLVDGLMKEASLKAASLAGKFNIPVMLDAGRVRPGMLRLAGMSDYIVASEEFSRGLRLTPRETLEKLSLLRPRAITVTLGSGGSITWDGGGGGRKEKGRIFLTPAFKVRAVDTTGAGDVFHGGYIYGLINGWEIRKTVEFASAFAALKCLAPGGRTGIPTLAETLRFIKEKGPGLYKTGR